MQELIEKYPQSREHLLEMLHDLQDNEPRNYLSEEALCAVAAYLDLSLAEVKGTASFYSMFSFAPRGKHVIRLCESPPCQLLGSTSILETLSNLLQVRIGETTADGLFTLETSSCLGVCSVAPAMMIDKQIFGNLTEEKIADIIATMRRQEDGS